MGIIEQASRRLEELRRSGIDVPQRAMSSQTARTALPVGDLPTRAASRLEGARPSLPAGSAAKGDGAATDLAPHPAGDERRSERIEIDLARLTDLGFVSPRAPRSQIADEFRVVKRALLANLSGVAQSPVDHSNLIMVTSAVPAEGKTFVAINLAISLAMELDKHVLLVDADIARPSVMRQLAIDRSVGFLDILADPTRDMSKMLLRTNIDKLTILPAGAPRALATEMMASGAMRTLLNEMVSRYPDRVIVFDSPPLLPSTEARVLATFMGQVVFVVAAERTPQKTVMQALATIDACPVVMPLLNKASQSEVGSYYGYYGSM